MKWLAVWILLVAGGWMLFSLFTLAGWIVFCEFSRWQCRRSERRAPVCDCPVLPDSGAPESDRPVSSSLAPAGRSQTVRLVVATPSRDRTAAPVAARRTTNPGGSR